MRRKTFLSSSSPRHPRWQSAVLEDKGFGSIVRALKGDALDQKIYNIKKIMNEYILIDNTLCHRSNLKCRAVVPFEFRRQIMTSYHNSMIGGHRVAEQTLNLISKSY